MVLYLLVVGKCPDTQDHCAVLHRMGLLRADNMIGDAAVDKLAGALLMCTELEFLNLSGASKVAHNLSHKS